ncbi:unnamed protein product [Lactuca saligna]|uniref:ATG8-interacting protein 1 n=1 Tax=Lactuca saligna TaxID=75948 RepID=A0AA35YPS5_LACSI|nr:unnamed protein product [Lactuca saligna]
MRDDNEGRQSGGGYDIDGGRYGGYGVVGWYTMVINNWGFDFGVTPPPSPISLSETCSLSIMADKEEGEETAPRGADWEVVSLTASTYAAAPSPDVKVKDPKDDEKSEVVDTDKSGTSDALFMSGHFVFPPSQHENLPLEPEKTEIGDDDDDGDGDVSESIKEEGEKSSAKDEDNWNISKLTESYGKRSDFEDATTLPGLEKEQNVLNVPKRMEDDDGSGAPYATWWKKQAVSLYSHAKEANTFWSIFISAAVMGLVIIGHQWQQERWQVLHHKWHSGVYDEKFGRMLGPLSRIKESIVGGNRRGFSIRGSTTRDH